MSFTASLRRAVTYSSGRYAYHGPAVMNANARHLSNVPPVRSVDQILDMTANKAFSYVFTRTLPLRSQPEIGGESGVEAAVSDIEASARRIMQAHLSRVTDDRAAVHLHAASLAVATHRVLQARLRDEARVMDIVRGAFGAGKDVEADAKLPGHWIGKAALLFSPNRMTAVRRMTQNATNDFGSSFVVSRSDEEHGSVHKMTVSSCLYADVCHAEGLPALTRVFCSLDRALFSHVSPSAHGVVFEMNPTTLADGSDSHCEFTFRKKT